MLYDIEVPIFIGDEYDTIKGETSEIPVSKVIEPDSVDEILGDFLTDREGKKFDCEELKNMVLDYL